ncbi:MAG: pentapeptide repeat-containing protein [Streptomyces sp.]
MKPKLTRIALGASLALIVTGYALLLWRGPWWIDGVHLREKNLQPADGVVITGFRTSLIAMGAGAAAALGLYYTHKSHKHTEKLFEHTREKDRDQAELTREGQVTERYVEAIKLLSANDLTQRLGGIYSLERIMRDSEKDHITVVEVIVAFIRQHSSDGEESDASLKVWSRRHRKEDIQAALTVLTRRPVRDERSFTIDLREVDLRNADLTGINLERALMHEANLEGASLVGANLQGAALGGVHLQGASLTRANLDFAYLIGANLTKANFYKASLRSASLASANLKRARLNDATLTGASCIGTNFTYASMTGANLTNTYLREAILHFTDLDGATMSGVRHLASGQLQGAVVTLSTALPTELMDDDLVKVPPEQAAHRVPLEEGFELEEEHQGEDFTSE